MYEYLDKHKELRERMYASNVPGIHTQGTAAQFLIDGLRDHPDFNPIALTLRAQSATLTNDQLEAQHLHAETYLHRQTTTHANGTRQRHPKTSTRHTRQSTRGNRQARRPHNWSGKWCTLHGTSSHSTDEFIARMRVNATPQAQPTSSHQGMPNHALI